MPNITIEMGAKLFYEQIDIRSIVPFLLYLVIYYGFVYHKCGK